MNVMSIVKIHGDNKMYIEASRKGTNGVSTRGVTANFVILILVIGLLVIVIFNSNSNNNDDSSNQTSSNNDNNNGSTAKASGKGQLGSALMGSLQIYVFDRGTFFGYSR